MPHADYDDGLVPRLRDSQDGKRGLRRARCGFLACWQSCCSRMLAVSLPIRSENYFIGF
jgi:hypothetical protein